MLDIDTSIKNKKAFLNRVNRPLENFHVQIHYSFGRTQIALCSENASSNSELDETEEHDIDHNADNPYAFVPFNRHAVTMEMASPGYHTYFSFNEKDIVSVEKYCKTKGKKQKVISETYIVGFLDGTVRMAESDVWTVSNVKFVFPVKD